MVNLVLLLEAAQYGNGILHAWLFNQYRLEAPLKRRILFNVLAVLVNGGCADTVEFTPCQRGLQHIGRIHCAVGLSGAYKCVNLINKQDHLALAL